MSKNSQFSLIDRRSTQIYCSVDCDKSRLRC